MVNNLYKNKFRIKTSRLAGWDYSQYGYYFITICTDKRKLFFGAVKKGEVELNYIGIISKEYWLNIPKHFPFVELDEFIVMPNHIHGIVIINTE